jgi:hypothetical protein
MRKNHPVFLATNIFLLKKVYYDLMMWMQPASVAA